MPITDWPKEDRPREKLLSKGAGLLTDAELIAIVLNSGTPGKTALEVAMELLAEAGDLKKLCALAPSVLLHKAGVGRAKYAKLKAAVEIGKRCLQCLILPGESLHHSNKALPFLSDKLRHHVNEVFACVFLDTHLRLICYEELFQGTVNEASIYPREIVRRGLQHNAAKVILAHNHPSGRITPSQADKDITTLIQQALALVDMQVVDHIIVGTEGAFSFAAHHLLTV